jgi:hypothetical protein
MEAQEMDCLHQRDAYTHEAIKDCVHDLARRCGHDRTHSRIELQCLQLSQEMTEQARRAEARPEA